MLERIKKILPYYAFIPLITCFMWNNIIYTGTRIINGDLRHYDMTTAFDKSIPVIPAFIVVYFGCFAFWGMFYIANMRVGIKECAKFATFDLITRTVCAVLFIAIPTHNIRPDICGNDFFSWGLRYLYVIDAADNLFPSIHCLVSWNCFVGIRGLRCYKRKYKILACVMAILVFMSTLVTRQHVIADVISAVIISEVCWWLVNHSKCYIWVWKVFHRINGRLFAMYGKRKRDVY